jgi:anaerobic magnesium-protoporphyrin IX monomethyl ester cyclase
LAEVDYLVERFKVKEINLFDDGFGLDVGRIKQFCAKVIERRYKDLIFSIPNGIRADVGDYEMFKLMERAGFHLISLGIDSGSQQVLNKINRDLSLERANETLDMINKTKIKVKLHFMIGLPFDTAETIKQTIDLAKSMLTQNHCVFTTSFLLALPLPETKFYQIVEKEGRFLCDLALNSTNVYKGPVYEIGNLKSSDIGRMFAKANREIAIMPSFIWRNIKMGHKSLRFIPSAIKYLWDKLFYGGRIIDGRA